MVLAFVTGIRARSLASDWDYLVWLLDRTIESMLSQRESEVRVLVACHDIPLTSKFSRDTRVRFLQVGFAPPTRDNDDMCVDKVLKLSVGAKEARDAGCEYIAFNDADDLVSNRIGGWVEKHPGAPGWFSGTQFFFDYGRHVLRFQKIRPPLSGPFVIARSALLEFVRPPFYGAWVRMISGGGEERYLRLLATREQPVCILAAVGLEHFLLFSRISGWPLLQLPFPANIVINHRHSMSHIPGGKGAYSEALSLQWKSPRKVLGRARRALAILPTLRLMSSTLRSEYSVAHGDALPKDYRGRGSIFWR